MRIICFLRICTIMLDLSKSKLLQSWEDMQSKINVEKQVKGINLEPLNVDQLAGTVGPLLEVRY